MQNTIITDATVVPSASPDINTEIINVEADTNENAEVSLRAFLLHVLPEEGLKCWFTISNGNPEQGFVSSVEELERILISYNQAGLNSYFGCASYTAEGRRKKENVQFAKAFWIDIDAGKGKPYQDASKAYEALKLFCKKAKLPIPTVVCSGNGLHVWWVLDRSLTYQEWRPAAEALKAIAEDYGVKADPSRTSDIASILRPVQTHNRKEPNNPLPVTCYKLMPTVAADSFISEVMRNFALLRAKKMAMAVPYKKAKVDSANSVYTNSDPSYAAVASEHCNQLKSFRDIKGNVSEPIWYANLCVLAHCADGEELAQEWSSGHPNYSPKETKAKFIQAQKNSGPTTCTRFEGMNSEACKGCAYKGEIRSPIVLGRSIPKRQIVFENTDLGNAKRLVDRYGHKIRYVPEIKKWLIWSGKQWSYDADGAIDRMAKDTIENILPADKTRLKKEDLRHAENSQKAPAIANTITLARTEQEVVLSATKIDADPMLLGIQNGVIDLATQTFRVSSVEDYVLQRCNVNYDAEAKCPNWIKFIADFSGGDAEYQTYLQKMCGYILSGLVKEEALFIFQGGGSNGKTTLRETIRELMGNYAVVADASLLMERTNNNGSATPELARLKGKRLVVASESQEDQRLNEQRVKYITGNEQISARGNYQDFFDFMPTHKVIFTTNHLPIIHGSDNGIWRRLHYIQSRMAISEGQKISDFRERFLMPELSGILNWALEGFRQYQKTALPMPSCLKEAISSYRNDMDVIGQFVAQETERDAEARILFKQCYHIYKTWCQEEGLYSLGKKRFSAQMRERGHNIEAGTRNQSYIHGLKMIDHLPPL